MSVALGWLAVVLAGVGAAPDKETDHRNIAYTLRLIETDGLGWREAAYSQLQPVARQGSATVWTAPRETALELFGKVAIKETPRVTGLTGQPVHISTRSTRQMVTQVAWRGEDAPPKVTPEKFRVGTMATMTGRKLDQGVLVQLVLEDTQILAVHKVSLGRCAQPKACIETSELDAIDCKGEDSKLAQPIVLPKGRGVTAAVSNESWRAVKETDESKVAVEIPEMGSQEVAGEWLVPNESVLLVSLGVHTIMGEEGKAVVRERLAVLEAHESNSQANVIPASTGSLTVPTLLPRPARPLIEPVRVLPPVIVGTVPVKVPALPGRSFPQGVHADGRIAEAPAVPADEVDMDLPGDSSDPAPSPQSKFRPGSKAAYPKTAIGEDEAADEASEPAPIERSRSIPPPKPATDFGANKVEFTLPKLPGLPGWLSGVAPMSGLQFVMPIKPLSIKLPFNQKLEIEIMGKVVADPESTTR
jgi:hypothetical protein